MCKLIARGKPDLLINMYCLGDQGRAIILYLENYRELGVAQSFRRGDLRYELLLVDPCMVKQRGYVLGASARILQGFMNQARLRIFELRTDFQLDTLWRLCVSLKTRWF